MFDENILNSLMNMIVDTDDDERREELTSLYREKYQQILEKHKRQLGSCNCRICIKHS